MTRAGRPSPAPRADRRRDWYTIRDADADSGEATEILIYDEIGDTWWGGVSAKQFAKDLSAIDADAITVRLNSPGGDVFDGIAILNALREHKARITIRVDGLAASAASFIAMAGDEIVMGRNSEMMIHDAWGYASGNAADMRKMAANLDRVSDNIASIYAERTNTDAAEWREVMKEEAWYSADEAVAAGLADRAEKKATDDTDEDIDARAAFDLSIFNYAGRKAAPAPRTLAISASTATGSPAADTTTRGGSTVAFTDEQTSELREAVGLPEDASDQEIFDAVLDELTQPAESDDGTENRAALPDGVVAVEAAVLEELRTNAARGAQARAQQETDARTALVSAAVKDGRIAPARKQHWLDALAADEGAAQTLASLAPGLVPVEAVGHGVNTENANHDLGWFTTTKEA